MIDLQTNLSEVELMTCAYRKIYEIETTLRKIIRENLYKEYGPTWQYIAPQKYLKRFVKPIESTPLHTLINYFNIYPPLKGIFSQREKISFIHLPNIRNKVAHSNNLNNDELNYLNRVYIIVISLR